MNLKPERLKSMSLKELAEEWGIDYEVFKIKRQLVKKIQTHCKKHNISQRSLANQTPGLTQDRISKIFNGQVGKMTIDKLIQILSILKIKVKVHLKPAA